MFHSLVCWSYRYKVYDRLRVPGSWIEENVKQGEIYNQIVCVYSKYACLSMILVTLNNKTSEYTKHHECLCLYHISSPDCNSRFSFLFHLSQKYQWERRQICGHPCLCSCLYPCISSSQSPSWWDPISIYTVDLHYSSSSNPSYQLTPTCQSVLILLNQWQEVWAGTDQ